MKFGLVVAVVLAAGLSMPAIADPRPRHAAAAPHAGDAAAAVGGAAVAPLLPALGAAPPIALNAIADNTELAPLNPDAPVTQVVTLPPAAETDDEVAPQDEPAVESVSGVALAFASVAVLLFIAGRLRHDA